MFQTLDDGVDGGGHHLLLVPRRTIRLRRLFQYNRLNAPCVLRFVRMAGHKEKLSVVTLRFASILKGLTNLYSLKFGVPQLSQYTESVYRIIIVLCVQEVVTHFI